MLSKINEIIMASKLYLRNGNYVFLDKHLAVFFTGVFKMKWAQSVVRPRYAKQILDITKEVLGTFCNL